MSAAEPSDPFDEAIADSWATSAADDMARSRKVAWIVASIAAALALLEAIALVWLVPLKETVPYTILVDRQTGYVERLGTTDQRIIAPDAALTRSFLIQYVIARESYDYDDVSDDYRKVALWSAGEARERYLSLMREANPASPVATYGPDTNVRVDITSVSSLGANRAMVRYATRYEDRTGEANSVQNWVAIIDYRFSAASMTADDRLINPLGFQVVRYRSDPESLPEQTSEPLTASDQVPQ